ncbi:MAG TPA: VCBS repeat-containing protein [Gemmatimonadales bacterium]
MNALRAVASFALVPLAVSLVAAAAVSAQDFSRFIPLGCGNRTPGIALGDVNGDGRLDLVFGNGRHMPQPNLLYINGSPVDLFFPPRPLGSSATYAVVLGDLNRDGHLDLVEGNDFGYPKVVWMNDGRGNFATRFAFGPADRTRDLAVGDLTGDGFADIVVANFVVLPGDASRVYVNDGRAGFSDVRPLAVGDADAAAVALGDVNGDSWRDIVLGNLRGSSNYLYLNDGKGHFGTPVQFGPREDDTQAVAVADLNGDQHFDIVVGNMNGPDRVFFGDGSGAFSRSISFGPERGPTRAIAVADMDGNGTLDVVVGSEAVDAVLVAPDGSTVRTPDTPGPTIFEYQLRDAMNRVYLSDGQGNLRAGPTFGPPGTPTRAVALGDVDGDGRADIIVGNNCADNAIYLNRQVISGR